MNTVLKARLTVCCVIAPKVYFMLVSLERSDGPVVLDEIDFHTASVLVMFPASPNRALTRCLEIMFMAWQIKKRYDMNQRTNKGSLKVLLRICHGSYQYNTGTIVQCMCA